MSVALGCTTKTRMFRDAAAEVMKCPAGDITLTKEGGHRYRGDGCGESVLLVCIDRDETTGGGSSTLEIKGLRQPVSCQRIDATNDETHSPPR